MHNLTVHWFICTLFLIVYSGKLPNADASRDSSHKACHSVRTGLITQQRQTRHGGGNERDGDNLESWWKIWEVIRNNNNCWKVAQTTPSANLHYLLWGLAGLHANFFSCLCLEENIMSNFVPECDDLMCPGLAANTSVLVEKTPLTSCPKVVRWWYLSASLTTMLKRLMFSRHPSC